MRKTVPEVLKTARARSARDVFKIVFLTCYHDNYFKYFMLVPQWFCQQGEGFQSINQSV